MSGARMVVAVLSVSVATGCGIALPSGPLLERSLPVTQSIRNACPNQTDVDILSDLAFLERQRIGFWPSVATYNEAVQNISRFCFSDVCESCRLAMINFVYGVD